MSLKLYKRGTVIRNHILFILLSIVFLQVVQSLANEITAFDIDTFLNLILNNKGTMALGSLALLTTFTAKKISKYIFALFSLLIIYQTATFFFLDFDQKLILILGFLYILLSFYFYIFLEIELSEAVYMPGYQKNYVGRKSEYELNVKLESSLIKSEGILSNWGETCCFVSLNAADRIPQGKIKIYIQFEGKEFIQLGQVVSQYEKGIGVKFLENEAKSQLGWREFYGIIFDRGFKPRFQG